MRRFNHLLWQIVRPIKMPHVWQDMVLAVPRIAYGFFLTSDFGASKFGLPWSPADSNLRLFEVSYWFPNDIAAYGGLFAKFPDFFAWMAAFSEAVGGLFLMAGLLSRPFAFLIAITMFVAAFYQQFNNGLWNMLPAMGFLWVCLFYSILGSGRFGLDHLLSKKFNR